MLPVYIKADNFLAHSGDELNSQTSCYAAKSPAWRSRDPEVIRFFSLPDSLHLSTRYTADGRPGPGRFPRRRVWTGQVDQNDARPVSGLPKNFYDRHWLQTFWNHDLHAYKKLNVQPPVDIRFSRNIKV